MTRVNSDRYLESYVLLYLGLLAHHLGDDHAAWDASQAALLLARQIGNWWGESSALAYVSMLMQDLGDPAALASGQEALRIARAKGMRDRQAHALTCLGHVQARLGQFEAAAASYRQAWDMRCELGQHQKAIEPLACLAHTSLRLGDKAQALGHVEACLAALLVGPSDGSVDPFAAELACYHVLCDSGDARAHMLIDLTHARLQTRAAKLPDERSRHMFLERVAHQRELVAAWRAHQARLDERAAGAP